MDVPRQMLYLCGATAAIFAAKACEQRELQAEEPNAPDVGKLEEVQKQLTAEGLECDDEDDFAAPATSFRLRGHRFLFARNVGVPDHPRAEWCTVLYSRGTQVAGKYASVRCSVAMDQLRATTRAACAFLIVGQRRR